MNQSYLLQPKELRAIRVEKQQILELLWHLLGKMELEKFQLPQNSSAREQITIEHRFMEERCEIILLAYHRVCVVDMEETMKYIYALPIEPLDSLLIHREDGKYFASIFLPVFGAPKEHFSNKTLPRVWDWRRLLGSRVVPLRKDEVRVIRLSRQALQELIWEYFVENGSCLFECADDDLTPELWDPTYSVQFSGKLDDVIVSLTRFENLLHGGTDRIDLYCRQRVPVTTKTLLLNQIVQPCYVTTSIPENLLKK